MANPQRIGYFIIAGRSEVTVRAMERCWIMQRSPVAPPLGVPLVRGRASTRNYDEELKQGAKRFSTKRKPKKRKGVPLGPFESVDSRSFYDDYTERNGGRPVRFYP